MHAKVAVIDEQMNYKRLNHDKITKQDISPFKK